MRSSRRQRPARGRSPAPMRPLTREGEKLQGLMEGGNGLRKIAGYLLAGTALIACPCHLVLLLPIVLGLLGGTALGATLAANSGWVVAAATVYFALALAGALHLLYRRAGNAKGSGRTPPTVREAGDRREKTEASSS